MPNSTFTLKIIGIKKSNSSRHYNKKIDSWKIKSKSYKWGFVKNKCKTTDWNITRIKNNLQYNNWTDNSCKKYHFSLNKYKVTSVLKNNHNNHLKRKIDLHYNIHLCKVMMNMGLEVRRKRLFFNIIWIKFLRLLSETVRNICVCCVVKIRMITFRSRCLIIRRLTMHFLKLWNWVSLISKD